MNANVGSLDRQIRISSGIVLIALVLTGVLGPWGWVGLVPLATGLFNFCPLYSLVGINSCNIEGIRTSSDGWSPYLAGALVGVWYSPNSLDIFLSAISPLSEKNAICMI